MAITVCIAPILGPLSLGGGQAYAMGNYKLTAMPNADSGNGILGGKETRLTWEGTPDSGESIASVTFVIPNGTDFSTEKASAMFLTGQDGLTRVNLDPTFSVDQSANGQELTVAFSNPTEGKGYIRIIIHGVYFPISGGAFQMTGSYTTADGRTTSMGLLPEIDVTEVSWAYAASLWLEEQPWVQAWNSHMFLQLFLNPAIAVRSLPSVFGGFLMALAVVALAFPLAIPWGLVLSFMRISRFKVLRGIGTTYVNIVRGTPLFLQIYIMFFGLPMAGVNLPYYVMAVIVLFLNSGAYLCEIFRAGIQSIPRGQFEASRSLGMSGAQTMIFVIIPQTVRRVIPTMTSEFILLYKDTSLLASVGFMEIIMYAKSIVAGTGSITPYIVAACFYLIITLPLAKVVGNLERRLASNDTGSSTPKKKSKKGKKSRSWNSIMPAGPEVDVLGDNSYVVPDTIAPGERGER